MRTAARALGKLLVQSNRPIPTPPSQPSCSRWLTCSCCYKQTYFSSNKEQIRPKKSSTQKTLPLPETSPSNPKSTAHFLPLPPRLPYSPTSHPFKRHLEILSLSTISSTPEESWRVYLSLHPSLRRYIPDEVFRSLLSHQLSNHSLKARWIRARSLIEFGQTCGMSMGSLGSKVVESALEAGLTYALEVKKGVSGLNGILQSLWIGLKEMRKGDMLHVDLEIRRKWIKFHSMGVEGWKGRVKTGSGLDGEEYPYRPPPEIIKEIILSRGHEGLEDLLDDLLKTSRSLGLEIAKQSLEVGIWSWDRGVDISDDTVEVLMKKIRAQGVDELTEAVRAATAGVSKDIKRRAETAYEAARYTPAEIASTLLAQEAPLSAPVLLELGLKMLKGKFTPSSAELEIALTVCQRLSLIRDSDAEEVYHSLAQRLFDASQTPSPPEAIIIQFAKNLSSASTHPTFLRRILLSLIPLSSPEAYATARQIYPSVRLSGFRWTAYSLPLARQLFNRAIHPDTRHLHFASRLYADTLADGQKLYRQDMLAMIRSIGMSKNASRPILFERHLRDYVDFYPEGKGYLVSALIEGLTSGSSADDALLAWTLVKRLEYGNKEISIIPIMKNLAQSSQLKYRKAMMEIISYQSSNLPILPELHDIALTSLIYRAHSNPDRNGLSHEEALGQAGTLLRDMAVKSIHPTANIATALVRGLVEVDQLDNAIAMLEMLGKAGIKVKSSAVGRLMVRLSIKERFDDAEEVERAWRASLGSTDVYDQGVKGARVLMDTIRGVEVNQRVKRRINKPFLTLIKSFEKEAKVIEDVEEAEEVVVQVQETPQEQTEEVREPAEEKQRVHAGGRSIQEGLRFRNSTIQFAVPGVGSMAV